MPTTKPKKKAARKKKAAATPKPPPEQQQKPRVSNDAASPLGFCKEILKVENPYPWQVAVLEDMDPKNCRVALRAANGSGKTKNCSAPLALWNALINPGSTTILTSGAMRQVKEQGMPHIKRLARQLPEGLVTKMNAADLEFAHGSKIIGFTASDPGLFEGFHRTGLNDSLMIIVDEAKSVDDGIFDAVERCQPDRLFVCSSPGGSQGRFYRIFKKEAAFWKIHAVTAFDCPHIDRKWIEMQRNIHGESHPLYRSMVMGEWMEESGVLLVIYPAVLDYALEHPPEPKGKEIVIGCDFAAGGDENVLCWREGNRVMPLITWHEKDTMASVGRFLTEFKRLGVLPEYVFADAGGLGGPMCDALAEAGFPVNRVNFGGTPFEPYHYKDRAAEMWSSMARLIETCDVVLPEKNELLEKQLVDRISKVDSKGRIELESKDAMRKRGVSSPDRADALALCLCGAGRPLDQWNNLTRPGVDFAELLQQAAIEHLPGAEIAGCHTG